LRYAYGLFIVATSSDKSHYGELPDGWALATVRDVFTFQGGYAYKSNSYVKNSDNLLIRIGNVKNDTILFDSSPVYISDELAAETSQYCIRTNDMLFTMTGTKFKRDYFFTTVITDSNLSVKNMYLNQRVGCLRAYLPIEVKCFCYFMKHKLVLDKVFIKETGTANQGNIGSEDTLSLLIPVPPVSEQRRIVAAIESAFAVIDEIERNKTDLAAAVIAAKQKILSLAVTGKLVQQDPADEPASALLKRVRAEREALVKAGKIKPDKREKETAVTRDNSHYGELPVEWEIVRLFDLGQIVGGGTPSTKENKYWKGDISWITPADLSGYTDKYISRGSRNITQSGLTASSAVVMPTGSVLMSSRAPIGYCVISSNEVCTNQGFKSVVPYIAEINEYLYYYLLASVEDIRSRASGTTFKEISGTEFGNTIVLLPPLGEQLRIVSAIEAAYAILDVISSNIR
jgi:type I restriction enzyme S subunit